jgi:prolipoprotein diacylglyceryltransferase
VRYWLFVAAYSFGSFALGFTRGDDVLTVSGWRIDQVLDALLFSTALIALLRLRLKRRPVPQPDALASARTSQS